MSNFFLVGNSKRRSELERLFWSYLVRLLDRLWNQFTADMYLLQAELEKCGLVYVDGEIQYLGDKENSNV